MSARVTAKIVLECDRCAATIASDTGLDPSPEDVVGQALDDLAARRGWTCETGQDGVTRDYCDMCGGA